MEKRFVKLMMVLAAMIAVFILTDTGFAQRKEARGRKYNKANVDRVVVRVEERVDNFVKHYDKSLDRSKLDGTEREDWLMKRARDLESATDELRREFDRRDKWIENKSEVRSCLNIASDIDSNMKNQKYSKDTEDIWTRVRFELNTLADIFELPKVGSGAY